MSDSVVGTVRKYVDEWLSTDILPKNKLQLLSPPTSKAPSKGKLQLQSVKKGYMKLLVRAVDTDIVVLAITTLNNAKP